MFRRHRASAPLEQASRPAPELSEASDAELERLTAPEAADARPVQLSVPDVVKAKVRK